MKLLKKTAASLAMAATLAGGLAFTTGASALPVHDLGVDGPLVNPNGRGQVLIYPYYTVRDGQNSFFNITNTSDRTVAIKVRFHEQFNSRDVLDFTVVLSPFDVWTGLVTEGLTNYPEDGDTGPVVKSYDNSCIIDNEWELYDPRIGGTGKPLSNDSYANTRPNSTSDDVGTDGIDRAREGYVTVIGMGVSEDENRDWGDYSVAYYAKHDSNGIPRDCDKVRAAFASPHAVVFPPDFPFTDHDNDYQLVPALGIANGDGDPEAAKQFVKFSNHNNPLQGNFSIIKQQAGIGAGIQAVPIASFMNNIPKFVSGTQGPINPFYYKNLITAQTFPYNLEPSLASRDGLWNTHGLGAFEQAIGSSGITNEWAFNEGTGAKTDWVATFPTKRFHVDSRDASGLSYLCVNIGSQGPCFMDRGIWNEFGGAVGGAFIPYRSDQMTPLTKVQNIYAGINPWRTGSGFGIGNVFEDNLTALGAPVKIDMIGYDREEQEVNELGLNITSSPSADVGAQLTAEANVISFNPTGVQSSLGSEFTINWDVSAALGNDAPNGWIDLEMYATSCSQFWPTQYLADARINDPDSPYLVEQFLVWQYECNTDVQNFPVVGFLYKIRDQDEPDNAYAQIMQHAWYND